MRDSSGPRVFAESDIGLSIPRHLLADEFDLCRGKQRGFTDLQTAVILPGQRLDLDSEPERAGQRGADCDHPMVSEQTGHTPLERLDRMRRQFRRAEGRIWRAT